ncbi:MAG: hypothetical protein QW551_01800 [Desulfurococcaceae archaeon]
MSHQLELKQYIICKSDCTLRYIESLAMIGLIEQAEILDCNKPRFKKIVAHLINTESVESMCYFEEEIFQSIKIINTYIELIHRKRN